MSMTVLIDYTLRYLDSGPLSPSFTLYSAQDSWSCAGFSDKMISTDKYLLLQYTYGHLFLT